MSKINFHLEFDSETGEIKVINLSTKEEKTASLNKIVVEENPNPQLILMESKYVLNSAATALLNVKPGDRIDIKYDNGNPIIGTEAGFGVGNAVGNKLTKSNTVSYRGNANKQLATFGDHFDIIAHPNKEGLFILHGNLQNEIIIEDPHLQTPPEDDTVLMGEVEIGDLDLEALLNGGDPNSPVFSYDLKLED